MLIDNVRVIATNNLLLTQVKSLTKTNIVSTATRRSVNKFCTPQPYV